MNTTGKLLEISHGDDLSSISALDNKLMPRAWAREQWEDLDLEHYLLWTWNSGEQILGFALFSFVQGDDSAHLLKICLEKELRGRGEAETLWKELLSQLSRRNISQLYLEVEENNDRAIGFYKKVGFRHLRTVKGYYSDGANGLMMLLML